MEESGTSKAVVPLNVPTNAQSVFLFGGTFDPPHLAHTRIAMNAVRRADADAWIVYVPAARSPFKPHGPEASDADRVRMLEIATASLTRCTVWPEELRRAGTSYTIDTVRCARALLPGAAEVRLLIGSDQAVAFHRWREARELVRQTHPLVMLRDPHASADDVIAAMRSERFWSDNEVDEWRRRIDASERLPLAATGVRELIANGGPDAMLLKELDPGVLEYIRERGLYGSSSEHIRHPR